MVFPKPYGRITGRCRIPGGILGGRPFRQGPAIQGIIGLRLVEDFALVRIEFQFAARMQVHQAAGARSGISAVLDQDISLGVEIDVPDAAFLVAPSIDQQNAFRETGTDNAMLHQYLSPEQHHMHIAVHPGSNLVRIHDNGSGLAGHIPRQSDEVIRVNQGKGPC